MKEKPVPADKLKAGNTETDVEFISDSLEQIQVSIRQVGYFDKLGQAFKVAIDRVKKTAQ